MELSPLIVGSGMAGTAIARAIQIVALQNPELKIEPIRKLNRGQPLKEAFEGLTNPILFIANPPGLHAELIAEADRLGAHGIFTEKPAATTMDHLRLLAGVRSKVAVFHGYRQMWGPQTLRELISSGEAGELISLESRYWQPSVAHRAIYPDDKGRNTGWKNDVKLNGPTDVLLDLGTHWTDLATFVLGGLPKKCTGWISYINAEAPHRDTHLHLTLDYKSGPRAIGSISKTVHGATNGLEINVLGARRSFHWNFMAPDEIIVGEGRDKKILTRKSSAHSAGLPAYHGLGWLEGYVEIITQYLREKEARSFTPYPELKEAMAVTDLLLSAEVTGLRKFEA